MVASDAGMMDGRHTGLTRKAPSANCEVGRWQRLSRMCKSRVCHSWGQAGAMWGRHSLACPTLLILSFPNQHNGAVLTLPTGAMNFRCCYMGACMLGSCGCRYYPLFPVGG